MKDCTTCKYGFVDEQLGFPMCHHPLRFSEDCVDFNKHQEQEEPEKATGIEEKKLPDGLDEAATKYEEKATEIALRNSSPFEEELNGPTPTYSDAFKAGAEWMAGQGVTIEAKFIRSKLRGHISLPVFFKDGEQFNNGEDVIVQVRKK